MSMLASMVRRLVKMLAAPEPIHHLDALSLREWADLPPHHPIVDCPSGSLPR